jgi:hypothetical protein
MDEIELREYLKVKLQNESESKLSKKIKIDSRTLTAFIDGNKNHKSTTIQKISSFVEKDRSNSVISGTPKINETTPKNNKISSISKEEMNDKTHSGNSINEHVLSDETDQNMTTQTFEATKNQLTISEFNLGAYNYVAFKLKQEITSFFLNNDIVVFTEASSRRNRDFLENTFTGWKFFWFEVRSQDHIGIFINEKKNGIKLNGDLVHSFFGGYLVVPLCSQNFEFHLIPAHLRWKTHKHISRQLCFKSFKNYNNVICIGDLNIEPNEILGHEDFIVDRFSVAFTTKDKKTTIGGGRKDNVVYQKDKFQLKEKIRGDFHTDHYPIRVILEY